MGLLSELQPFFEFVGEFFLHMPTVYQFLFTFVFGSFFLFGLVKFLFSLFHK